MAKELSFVGEWQGNSKVVAEIELELGRRGVALERRESGYRGIFWDLVAKIADSMGIAAAITGFAMWVWNRQRRVAVGAVEKVRTGVTLVDPQGAELEIMTTTRAEEIAAFIAHASDEILARVEISELDRSH